MVDYRGPSAPSNLQTGETWLDTNADIVKVWSGNAWTYAGMQTVKRNASGGVLFSNVGSISTSTSGAGATATTNTTNVGVVSFSKVILINNGNGTAKILRDGGLLTSTTAAATVTYTGTNLGLTGTHTWTLSAIQTTATITATATVSIDSRQTINIR